MPLKTIFHLDQPERFSHLASNLTNYLAVEPDADLQVLVNGDAVAVLYDHAVGQFIQAHPQVTFFGCHNSLAQRKLDEAQLPTQVTVVPTGVVQIAQSEAAGYGYIKP